MTSQERFWQARLLSKESEHRGELSAIRQQLEALKATTEDAKADLAPSMKATDALPKQTVFEYSLEILKKILRRYTQTANTQFLSLSSVHQ